MVGLESACFKLALSKLAWNLNFWFGWGQLIADSWRGSGWAGLSAALWRQLRCGSCPGLLVLMRSVAGWPGLLTVLDCGPFACGVSLSLSCPAFFAALAWITKTGDIPLWKHQLLQINLLIPCVVITNGEIFCWDSLCATVRYLAKNWLGKLVKI